MHTNWVNVNWNVCSKSNILSCLDKTIIMTGVHTFFSSINPENQTVNVSNDPGLGQAKELFFLLSAKEGDYR